jgi:FAD/FMN-containing dehydrogenase
VADMQLADPNTHDAFNLFDVEETVASAVVAPASTDEVVKIVQWANKHVIPIYPISMGRNCKFGVIDIV